MLKDSRDEYDMDIEMQTLGFCFDPTMAQRRDNPSLHWVVFDEFSPDKTSFKLLLGGVEESI